MDWRAGRGPLTVVALVMATWPLACGTGGRYPVTGSVTYQGRPAAGAVVNFRREGETAEEALNFPMGLVDADGRFRLEVPGVGEGAVPGKYRVLVRWEAEVGRDAPAARPSGRAPARDKKDPMSSTDRLKFRYFNLEKPLLAAEVKPESNTLAAFELKD